MNTLTAFHVAISLIGIVSGLVVLTGFLSGSALGIWNAVFLVSTVLTSATGFGFPFERLLPSHIVGVISLVILAFAVYALYGQRLAGPWKRVYILSAVAALYFNVFVLVVQSFLKVPTLHEIAPTQSEPPFAIAQLVVLVLFAAAGTVAVRRSEKWRRSSSFDTRSVRT